MTKLLLLDSLLQETSYVGLEVGPVQ